MVVAKRYILDTHCLLWFQDDNPKLSETAKRIIEDANNVKLLSQICLFEIAIKQSIGKLPHFKSSIKDVFLQGIKDDFTFCLYKIII